MQTLHTNLHTHVDISLIKRESLRHNRVANDEKKVINLSFNEKTHDP